MLWSLRKTKIPSGGLLDASWKGVRTMSWAKWSMQLAHNFIYMHVRVGWSWHHLFGLCCRIRELASRKSSLLNIWCIISEKIKVYIKVTNWENICYYTNLLCTNWMHAHVKWLFLYWLVLSDLLIIIVVVFYLVMCAGGFFPWEVVHQTIIQT